MKRVVITGLGSCSPLGIGVEALRDGLFEGRSGTGPIRAFDPTPLRSRIAGEVTDFEPLEHLGRKLVRRSARFAQLALVAAQEALGQSGLAESERRDRFAVVIGSGIGGFDRMEKEHAIFLERGPGKFAPLTVPIIIPNMAAGLVAIETGCRGPNLCPSTACASGSHAVGMAVDLIRLGRCPAALAGGSESTISPFAVDGYCQLRALSTRNDRPQTASRPFSADRDGFVIAEAGAVLVLEELEHAKRRGAEIFAEIVGYGTSSDGYHATAPEPNAGGAVRAIEASLEDAGLTADAVDLINAHGTSTPLNDVVETRALHRVFGAHAGRLMVQATKSMTGHSLGAAGAVEAVAATLALHHQVVHPTTHLEQPDPECDLDYVPGAARDSPVEVVLSSSFGFGGHNSVLAFRRFR